jgi:hypothetical protein
VNSYVEQEVRPKTTRTLPITAQELSTDLDRVRWVPYLRAKHAKKKPLNPVKNTCLYYFTLVAVS